ncbi:MAG: CHC2 zinc finger domain-containing protein [Glycocaulis sp.]
MTHQSEFALVGAQRKSADRTRAETIKDAVGVEIVAGKLGANVRADSHGWRCDCPVCKGEGTVKISAHGEAWHCHACSAQGDVITFVEVAKGRGFLRACHWLEELIESRAAPCASTGNLFSGGASGSADPRKGSDARSGLQSAARPEGGEQS